jgi:hypothetical protein
MRRLTSASILSCLISLVLMVCVVFTSPVRRGLPSGHKGVPGARCELPGSRVTGPVTLVPAESFTALTKIHAEIDQSENEIEVLAAALLELERHTPHPLAVG